MTLLLSCSALARLLPCSCSFQVPASALLLLLSSFHPALSQLLSNSCPAPSIFLLCSAPLCSCFCLALALLLACSCPTPDLLWQSGVDVDQWAQRKNLTSSIRPSILKNADLDARISDVGYSGECLGCVLGWSTTTAARPRYDPGHGHKR